MRTNYRLNSGVRFQMLSRDQLQELFDGVLHVMEKIGLDVHHEEAREILASHKPSPVKPETVEAIDEIMRAAEERVAKEE